MVVGDFRGAGVRNLTARKGMRPELGGAGPGSVSMALFSYPPRVPGGYPSPPASGRGGAEMS